MQYLSFLIKHTCPVDLSRLNSEAGFFGGGSYFKERGQGGVIRLLGGMKKEQ